MQVCFSWNFPCFRELEPANPLHIPTVTHNENARVYSALRRPLFLVFELKSIKINQLDTTHQCSPPPETSSASSKQRTYPNHFYKTNYRIVFLKKKLNSIAEHNHINQESRIRAGSLLQQVKPTGKTSTRCSAKMLCADHKTK